MVRDCIEQVRFLSTKRRRSQSSVLHKLVADLVRHASLNYATYVPADDFFLNGLLLLFVSTFLQRHCVLGMVMLFSEPRTR